MKTMKIAAVPVRPAAEVKVIGDTIVAEYMELIDPSLAQFVTDLPEAEVIPVALESWRLGFLAQRRLSIGLETDFVERTFDRMAADFAKETDQRNREARLVLERMLNEVFGPGGKFPAKVDEFLGDGGRVARFFGDLFSVDRRDSAIGVMKDLLGKALDGKESMLGRALDPDSVRSPLRELKQRFDERIDRLEKAIEIGFATEKARQEVMAKTALKGMPFEDRIEELLGRLARGAGDDLERVTTTSGSTRRKTGDFIVTVMPGTPDELRVVFESKDNESGLTARKLRAFADGAKENREAVIAVMVLRQGQAPAGCGPIGVLGTDVVVEVGDESELELELVYRVVRVLALGQRQPGIVVDADAIRASVDRIRSALVNIRYIRGELTKVRTTADAIDAGMERLRATIASEVNAIVGQIGQ